MKGKGYFGIGCIRSGISDAILHNRTCKVRHIPIPMSRVIRRHFSKLYDARTTLVIILQV